MILHAIKVMMCGVSMVLTALFAFTFTGLALDNNTSWSAMDWLAGVLLVTVGICIDSGKYLFWYHRRRSSGLVAISLSLALFSWLASIAFFLAGERALTTHKQQLSPEYLAYEERLSSLRKELESRRQLAAQRLNSRYHDQWQAGEKQLQIIAEKQQSLVHLLAQKSQIGQSRILATLPSQQLFAAVSQLAGIGIHTVRLVFFAMLALLIECCALAVISLSRASTQTKKTVTTPSSHTGTPRETKERTKRARLINDIVHGNVEPVLRKIKTAGYGLPLDVVKSILSDLHRQGVLEEDIRNSFKLANNWPE